jgi:acetyltransferase-like isoleucine patch superfamily enzyme
MIGNPRYIHIGERVLIRKGVRLEAVVEDPDNPPEIRIGDDVTIEQDVHIVAIGRVHIQNKVGIAPRVTILGGIHPFFDVHSPVKIASRLAGATSLTEIGEGSMLGANSVVQMNARIGRHVVVGSGAVVRGRVPDGCVVDGNPGAVVLRYDREEDRWLPPAGARRR